MAQIRKRIQHCGKRSCKNPARPKYWRSGRLALRKLRNLVRSGYSPREALKVWTAARKRYSGELPTLTKIDRLG